MKIAFYPVMAACLLLAACGIDDSKDKKNNSSEQPVAQQPAVSPQSPDTVKAPATGHGADISKLTPDEILSYDQVADTINTQIFRGLLAYKKNTGIFIDCATNKAFKVIDATQTLQGKYLSFNNKNKPLYVELVGRLSGTKNPNFSRLFRVEHLNKMLLKLPYECEGAEGAMEAMKRKPI